MKIEITDINGNLGTSVVVIAWWVAIWFIFEEAILFVSGNRRHIKVTICLIIMFIVFVTCCFYPYHLKSF